MIACYWSTNVKSKYRYYRGGADIPRLAWSTCEANLEFSDPVFDKTFEVFNWYDMVGAENFVMKIFEENKYGGGPALGPFFWSNALGRRFAPR